MIRSSVLHIVKGIAVGGLVAMPFSIIARMFLNIDPFSLQGFFVAGAFGSLWGLVFSLMMRQREVKLSKMVEEQTASLIEANEHLRKEIEERARTEEKFRQSQKMEAIGRLAGGVAHDINNVLATVMTITSSMDMDLPEDSDFRKDTRDIIDACKRGRDMTISLLGFARKGDFTKRPTSLPVVVEDVKRLLRRIIPKTIEIQTWFESADIQISSDPSQLKNLLMNLCINAVDAMDDVGKLKIHIERKTLDKNNLGLLPGQYVSLKVVDTGEGMCEETIERAFDPFFTTKPEGKGTGLGLSRVWGIVREHGGAISIDSHLNKGTTINVLFPDLNIVHQDPGIKTSVTPHPAGNDALILLVEDEEMLRKAEKRMLAGFGYSVETAADGIEAIEVFERKQNNISLVMLDMIMPRMGGEATFTKMRKIKPNVPILICTGYSKEEGAARLVLEKKVGFIQKPFSPGSLSLQIDALLNN